jgi:hypothetical protein
MKMSDTPRTDDPFDEIVEDMEKIVSKIETPSADDIIMELESGLEDAQTLQCNCGSIEIEHGCPSCTKYESIIKKTKSSIQTLERELAQSRKWYDEQVDEIVKLRRDLADALGREKELRSALEFIQTQIVIGQPDKAFGRILSSAMQALSQQTPTHYTLLTLEELRTWSCTCGEFVDSNHPACKRCQKIEEMESGK